MFSFAKMIDSKLRKEAKKEDIAKALLVTVADNIGNIAVNAAFKLVNRLFFYLSE